MAPPRRKTKATRKKKNEKDIVDEKKAVLTIQTLSRKYLNKSPNISANDWGVIELHTSSSKKITQNTSTSSEESIKLKSKKLKPFNLSHTQRAIARPKRLSKHMSKDTSKTALGLAKECNVSLKSVLSPSIKPSLGSSTPSKVTETSSTQKENSLFGFEDMQTPLELSPVVSEMDELSMYESDSENPQTSMSEVFINNNIQPYIVPSRKKQAKKPGFCDSEVKKWVAEMNRQFEEVDKFKLAVE